MSLLDHLVKDSRSPRLKTLDCYLTKIARLGGYLTLAHDPPPGNTVMWRGPSRLTDFALRRRRRSRICGQLKGLPEGYLNREVSIPNSQESADYVFWRLDILDRNLVSLALDSALTTRLNAICSPKRIVRDAFFNQLLTLAR